MIERYINNAKPVRCMSTSSTADLSETLELMFGYCEKAVKFEKISQLFFEITYYLTLKQSGRF